MIEAVTLMPLRRGAAEGERVQVPRAVDSVKLNLRLEIDEFPRYRAVLRSSSGGAVLWQSDPIAAEPNGNRRAVPLAVPASVVRSGDYRIELEGVPARGAAENVGSYAFRAVIE